MISLMHFTSCPPSRSRAEPEYQRMKTVLSSYPLPMVMLLAMSVLVTDSVLMAQVPPAGDSIEPTVAWGAWQHWGGQGDGTYRNPVIPADYSDLDCIRVGKDYYAISSTFQFSPGVVILHSTDLVNWTIQAHAVADVTQISAELNWDRMNRYGKGVWAGAIRYH